METIQDSYFIDNNYYSDSQIMSGNISNHSFNQ